VVKSDILEAIAEMNSADLTQVVEMVQIRRRHLAEKVKVNFRVGDTVRVTRPLRKRGPWSRGVHSGELIKKNPKKAQVKIPNPNGYGNTIWHLPYTMIENV
jgi:hypothetical protein